MTNNLNDSIINGFMGNRSVITFISNTSLSYEQCTQYATSGDSGVMKYIGWIYLGELQYYIKDITQK